MMNIQNDLQNNVLMNQSERLSFIDLLMERSINMKELLVVDRIEGNFAVCENRNTGEIVNIEISELPKDIKEGTILNKIDNTYELDHISQEKIEKRIEEKMNKLWSN